MIFDATEVGCTHKYDFSESIGPIINHITPGSYDLSNWDAKQGIATSKAPFYGFDGLTAYMRSSGTWGLTDTFSVEAVFSISASTGAGQSQEICGDFDDTTAAGWFLYYFNDDGKIWFESYGAGWSLKIRVKTAAAITIGQVYHVVVTHNKTGGANNTNIYLRGLYNNTGTNAESPVQGLNFQVSDGGTSVFVLRGKVYLIRIFNRVLTTLEIEQNYEAERWRVPHTNHTWAVAPSVSAPHTYARMFNLANQYADLARDIGPIQATQVVAQSTSLKKVGADFICDGTADDVQIQAALDAAHAVGGGTVMILDGTYNLAAAVNVYDNITLCGVGRATILSTVGGVGTGAIRNADGDMGNSGIIIRDLTIASSGGAGVPTMDGIYLSGCIEPPYVSVQKVHFTNTYCGINVLYCEHVTIEGCSCVGASNGSYLVYCDHAAYVHIIGCMSLEFGGFFLINSNDCMVRSCVVTTHAIAAYFIFNCEHCAVVGCTSSGDTTGRPFEGVAVNGGVQNLICGNSLYYASYANIDIEADGAGSVIIGNTCSGGGPTDGHGIFLACRCEYMNVSGNAVVGNHASGIGSDTTVGVTLSYGCVNDNEVFYNGKNGLELADALYSTMNGNVVTQNGANTDNAWTNLAFSTGAAGGASENIAFGNSAYKGGAAPRTGYGFWVGIGSNNNLVTGNNLKESGHSTIFYDGGTGTDKTAWKAAGNKIA
jgi:hypothetical protein